MATTTRSFRFSTRVAFTCLGMIFAGEAGAQGSCAVPATLAVNMTQWFDTCQGDYGIVVACAVDALRGPALMVHMPLTYPAGVLTVQSVTANYDPAVFLMRGCTNSSWCALAVDSEPGFGAETLDLGTVDSGDYFLAVAPVNYDSLSCGQVYITYDMTAEDLELSQEGVFRGGLPAQSSLPPTGSQLTGSH